jgi:cyclic pyranopterin phosphate synthase
MLIDPFGRKINYLRVSITDRCNFRCVYCMPEQGFPATPKEENLTADEIARIVRVAAFLGMRKVRITGGEPLLRKDLPNLLRQFGELDDLSCTTNGFLLAPMAKDLARAGLSRINISLDTLRPERFTQIARRGSLDAVMSGLEAAFSAGLKPIKVNCVLMKGVNDDEVGDFARWTFKEPVHVRFIELMPMRWNLDSTSARAYPTGPNLLQLRQCGGDMLSDAQMRRMFCSASDAKANIESQFGSLGPADIPTNGPARTYRLTGAVGTVGFISQITNDFCSNCNRLRLTHDGFLRPCLMDDGELDLRSPLRRGATDADVAQMFRQVVCAKPERHYLHEGQRVVCRGMSQIGG